MKSEGFWMAVLGSKAVGAGADADGDVEKLSCGSGGDCAAVAFDFLPVRTSQLMMN
jgi:hypothetical protein